MRIFVGTNTFAILCVYSVDFISSTEGNSVTRKILVPNSMTNCFGRISKIVVDSFGVNNIESTTYF